MKIVGSYVLLKLLTSCMKYGVRSISLSLSVLIAIPVTIIIWLEW